MTRNRSYTRGSKNQHRFCVQLRPFHRLNHNNSSHSSQLCAPPIEHYLVFLVIIHA
uniref:Uncharacterized protein n=1 Tax=Anguilla anguilla TaxID=7936 RepID=A0A0E9R304_ANGAN